MAVRAGAKTVHACELSSVMVTLSSEILAANQMSGAVQVHHTISTNLDALPSRYIEPNYCRDNLYMLLL